MTTNLKSSSNASIKSFKGKRLMTTNSIEDRYKKDISKYGDKENDRDRV